MYAFIYSGWLLAFTLVLWFSSFAHAGINQWTSKGPEGGTVQALAIDPANPNILYAGTRENGVFKSTDGGASWTAVLPSTLVRVLAIDPITPTTVYATSGAAVLKSTDGGASWTRAAG